MENQINQSQTAPQTQSAYTANPNPPSERFWERNRLLLKALTIGVLALLLLIPQLFVSDLIRERDARKQEVISEISSKWASEQTISGPMIVIPYLETVLTENNKKVVQKNYMHLLPENLEVDGKLFPEEHRRSLYKVMLYKSEIAIKGNFLNTSIEKFNIPADKIIWSEAKLVLDITDFKGIQENVFVQWNSQSIPLGINYVDKDNTSLSAPLALSAGTIGNKHEFAIALKLKGTSEISFIPLGNTTKVHLSSAWKIPDFTGNVLPNFNKDFATKGIDANWSVLGINRSFPQSWNGETPEINNDAFGVRLLQGIDSYAKAKRTIKYSILIIFLTLAVYFFSEIVNKRLVHPIQYALVGFALILFYTLLLSISEYTGFNLAYLIAAIATIGLIAAYTHSIFKSIKTTALFSCFLSIIYLFVFLLVQLEDTALLVGSIGLFIILASIMYASRKVNWYSNTK